MTAGIAATASFLEKFFNSSSLIKKVNNIFF
jgi:hypothetical protein